MGYQSERTFRLWAYTVSHNILLLRSEMSTDEMDNLATNENSYTIDIEFWDVTYVDISSNLDGINLKITDISPIKFKEYNSFNRKVFELFSSNKSFYIVAGGCNVGKSKWINEHRLSNAYLEYDQILFSG